MAEMTFADLHRGQRVRLYDVDGEDLLPPVFLLLEDARPCESGVCCEAWALLPGRCTPYKLHSRCGAEVHLIPRQTASTSAPAELAALTGDRLAVYGADHTGEA